MKNPNPPKPAGTERWFHGGCPGLNIGDRILPRQELIEWDSVRVAYDHSAPENYEDADRAVFITQSPAFASAFAHAYVSPTLTPSPGDVYEVALEGPASPDPDFAHVYPSVVQAPSAVIVGIVERNVCLHPREWAKRRAPFICWTPEDPIWDENGYFQPSPQMRSKGLTAAIMRRLGRWFPYEYTNGSGRPSMRFAKQIHFLLVTDPNMSDWLDPEYRD